MLCTAVRPIAAQLSLYLGDLDEARDLTQEAFVRAWQRWDRISRYEEPATWIRRVAWNLATSRLRRLRIALRHQRLVLVEPLPAPGEHLAIGDALAELPDGQRRAVVLHYLVGLPVAEIAEVCRSVRAPSAPGSTGPALPRRQSRRLPRGATVTDDLRVGLVPNMNWPMRRSGPTGWPRSTRPRPGAGADGPSRGRPCWPSRCPAAAWPPGGWHRATTRRRRWAAAAATGPASTCRCSSAWAPPTRRSPG